MEQKQLKLAEFKAAYKALKTGTIWLDHLLLGLFVFIENVLINNRVKTEVDASVASYTEAIKEYETLHPVEPVSPVYTETPSETSTRLPEMRLTAPWYIDKVSERSEPPEGL